MGMKFRNLVVDDKKQDMKSRLKIHIHMIFGCYNYIWHFFGAIMRSHLIFVACQIFVGTCFITGLGWCVLVLGLFHLCALVFYTLHLTEQLPYYTIDIQVGRGPIDPLAYCGSGLKKWCSYIQTILLILKFESQLIDDKDLKYCILLQKHCIFENFQVSVIFHGDIDV